ncbi:DNA modification methylase, partial [mine drainage metagenome]
MPAIQTSLMGRETEVGWRTRRPASLEEELRDFQAFGTATTVLETVVTGADEERIVVPTFVNEFWTSKQRAANSLHEISYRACFKPQLPRFFIERLTHPGDHVYDPFMGRGTTLLEAALLGRIPLGCDVNPLSAMLLQPRLSPPTRPQLAARLSELNLTFPTALPAELLVFYHPETLAQICGLRDYLL